MSHKHQIRKKMRRQAKIIVGLMMALLVCFIVLLGFVFYEYILNRDKSIFTEPTHIDQQTETYTPQLTESEMTQITENTEIPIETAIEIIWPVASVPINLEGPDLSGYVVVIDPGHQQMPNLEQEPLAPWMSGSKDKSSEGATGVSTFRPEYDVNLAVGLILRDYLDALNCEVYLTRTTSDVDLSNIQRAEIAKEVDPDIYIRLYCDADEDPTLQGIRIFVADSGPYASQLCVWADQLGALLSEATESDYLGCDSSSRYTGLNWAADMPSFMLRMGYLTNILDDTMLSDPEYQLKICQAIADFVATMPQKANR